MAAMMRVFLGWSANLLSADSVRNPDHRAQEVAIEQLRKRHKENAGVKNQQPAATG